MAAPEAAPEPQDEHEDNVTEIPVDLDLDDLEDQYQREGAAQQTTVRLQGKVIHVLHIGDWPSSAMQSAGAGDWDSWARGVITDPAEYRIWVAADLPNRQIEAVFDACASQANMSRGKSARRAGSSRSSRRR